MVRHGSVPAQHCDAHASFLLGPGCGVLCLLVSFAASLATAHAPPEKAVHNKTEKSRNVGVTFEAKCYVR
jgi:hypothetical protein